MLARMWTSSTRPKSRAIQALLDVRKLDVGRTRLRHGFFSDAYVALALRSRRVTVQRQAIICFLFHDPCASWPSPATSFRSTSPKPSAAA